LSEQDRQAATVIRRAERSDVPEIMSLQQQSESAARWSSTEYERLISEARESFLVADEGGILGFLAATGTGEEWELENLVVEEGSRRKGLAKMLVERFLADARTQGARTVSLHVRHENVGARTLYEKSGFRVAGCRKGYYRDADAIIYVLDFT